MATSSGVVPVEEGELLDLSFLTVEEREKLESVLREDLNLRTRDRIRLGTLRQAYEQARVKQLQFKDKKQCSCCERPLGRVLNTGALCPSCGNRVDKSCRKPALTKSFICGVCEKQRWLEIQAREYRTVSPPTIEDTPASALPKAVKPALYGSELLRQSLLTSSHSSGELPEIDIERPRRTTSTASSIVVKYVERKDSCGPPSPSSSPAVQPSLPVPSEARKLTPDELSSTSSSEEDEEESGSKRQHSLLAPSDSLESINSATSMYSAVGGQGDYAITGKVELGVWFKHETLFVRVVKARGLAAAKSGGVSDPYVKTYLLPDKSKHTKRKTGVQRKTRDPEYNEVLKYKLSNTEIRSCTLWASVWDWDRFGRNQFLGEIRLPLPSLDLTDPSNRWYFLQEQQDDEDSIYRGKLKLAVKFLPHRPLQTQQGRRSKNAVGSLCVSIKEAEDLPKMDTFGLTDATVKLYLLPNRSSYSKKKTSVIKSSLSPAWNEDFEYKSLTVKELKTARVLEVTVWDFDRRGSYEFIGGLRLGPSRKHTEWMDCVGEEVSHWEEVLSRPGEWVERWHDLRASMVSLWKPPIVRSVRNVSALSPIGEAFSTQQSPADRDGDEAVPITAPAGAESVETPPTLSTYPLKATRLRDVEDPLSSSGSPDDVNGVPVGESGLTEWRTVISSTREFSPIPEVSNEEQEPSILKGRLGAGEAFGSISSMSGAKGDYDIIGDVLLKLQYAGNQLLIYVARARGLAAADSNGFSDPYIKTYLLPDKSKHSKRKTNVRKKTLNPVYKETLKYEVEESDFPSRTLWMSVWDWDRFGRNRFLGEIRLPLSEIDFSDSSERWFQLTEKESAQPVSAVAQEVSSSPRGLGRGVSQTSSPQQHSSAQSHDKDTQPTITTVVPPECKSHDKVVEPSTTTTTTTVVPRQVSDPSYRGEVRLGLKFSPGGVETTKRGTLHVAVKSAKCLPNMDKTGLTDGFVKLYLLPDKSAKGKRKTAVIKDNLDPVWEEMFAYERVSLEDLSNGRVLEVTVWDYDRGSSNELVGGLRVGPAPHRVTKHKEWMDSNREEAGHWEEALAKPGEWVERWHSLRSSMDLREIDLSNLSSLLSAEDEDKIEETASSNQLQRVSRELSPGGGTGAGAGISLSAIARATESVEQEEFKKVSVGEGAAQEHASVPLPQDSESHQELAMKFSVRRRPEVVSGGSGQDTEQEKPVINQRPSKETSMAPDKPPAGNPEALNSEASHLVKNGRPGTESPPLEKEASPVPSVDSSRITPSPPLKAARVSPYLRSPTPPSASPLLKQTKFHGSVSTLGSAVSFGSSFSVYTAAGGKEGNYDISGEVLLGVAYVDNHLEVKVGRARYLAPGKQGYSNPYVKTYLLPDKNRSTKQKTSIMKKTLNPVYNEVLKYQFSRLELASRTLWASVWDWDRFGRNQFLGEVRLPLSSMDLADSSEHWHTLLDKDDSAVDDFVRGELKVALMFKPASSLDRGTLNVQIKEARELPAMRASALTDAMVKCSLLPEHSSSSKKKTGVIKNNLNPVWEERFVYQQQSLRELVEDRVLEVTVWDHSKHGNNFVGGLHVGGAPGRAARHQKWMDSIGAEVSHWEGMLSRPGEWVEAWHVLRPSMVPREVDLSSPPPPFALPSWPAEQDEASVLPHSGTLNRAHLRTEPEVSSQLNIEHKHGSPNDEDRGAEVQSPVLFIPTVQLNTSNSPSKPTPDSEQSQQLQEEELKSKYQDGSPSKSGLLRLGATDSMASFGSMTSIYSAAGGKGDYDITGEVLFAVYFKSGLLVIHLSKARDLAGADSNGLSDPYIKTYLLPDKSKNTKKKTEVKKKTLNPVYDHTIKYKVSQRDAASRTLWMSVWDWDRFGRNQFLGEIRLPLASLNLTDLSDRWHSLQDQDTSEEGDTYKGQLKVALMFEEVASKKSTKTKGVLHVSIKQAKDLHNRNSSAMADGFVKCYLLPDTSSSGKRKTKVVKKDSNPVWEEPFKYDKLQLSELASERVLEVTVWDLNKGSSSEFIGGLRLGPAPRYSGKHKEWMDSIGEEVDHWDSVMAHPGVWQEAWHTLRTTMDYRSISLS